jgi:hypothetical protein
MTLSWDAVAGGIYRIQYALPVMPVQWLDWRDITATVDGIMSWANDIPAEIKAAYFRVKWLNAP